MSQKSGVGEETVTDTANSKEMLGAGGVVFDVAAQADDEVVDRAGVGVFVDAPDLFEDLFAGDDLAFALGEVAEEVGLHESEVGDAVGGDKLEGVEADGAVVEGVFVGLVRRGGGFGWTWRMPGGAAEQGFKSHEEDAEVERFGEVVVGAGFDTFEDLFGACAGGEHQDRSEVLGFTEGADDGEAVGAGKHAVEDDGGGFLLAMR